MFRQIYLSLYMTFSSLYLLEAYSGLHIIGGSSTNRFTLALCGMFFSFFMAKELVSPTHETPTKVGLFPSMSEASDWRFWFKVLVGMGWQSLFILACVAGPRAEIDREFIVLVCAIAVPTACLSAALLFAPEKKPASQTADA